MSKDKNIMSDYIGGFIEANTGYNKQQIKDMKTNKISLNAMGEPVRMIDGQLVVEQPKAGFATSNAFTGGPFFSALYGATKDYGGNTINTEDTNDYSVSEDERMAIKKKKLIDEIAQKRKSLASGKYDASYIRPPSGALGKMGIETVLKMFK